MARREALSRIAEEVAQGLGVELYWLDYRKAPGRSWLQVMIDKEGGVTLGDCERMSRALEEPFDGQIEHSYELEVSSPGVDRPLYTDRHFARVVGEKIRVKTYTPVRRRRVWRGRLAAHHPDRVVLQTPDGPVEIPRSEVADARVSPDLDLP